MPRRRDGATDPPLEGPATLGDPRPGPAAGRVARPEPRRDPPGSLRRERAGRLLGCRVGFRGRGPDHTGRGRSGSPRSPGRGRAARPHSGRGAPLDDQTARPRGMSLSAPALSPQTIVRPLLTLFVAVLGLVVFLPLPAHAFENKAWGDVTVGPEETVPEVSTGVGNVTVDGVVEGDVKSGMGDVVVNGEVGDDIKAGRGYVVVNGPVSGEIEAGFGDVYVNDRVEGDVEVGHGDLELRESGLVLGEVFLGSGEFRGNKDAVEGAVLTAVRPDVDHEPDWFGIPNLVGWAFGTAAFAACS